MYARVTRPTFEHHHGDVLGLGVPTPRISWATEGDAVDWHQEAYELQVQWSDGDLNTFASVSSESRLVEWPWRPLRSREGAAVRVRARNTGETSFTDWSEAATVEAGLLEHCDWTCSLIQIPCTSSDLLRRPVAFSRTLSTRDGIVRARLYITSQGIYETKLNAHAVGDHVLAPGWTSYKHRLLYQTHDITPCLRSGSLNLLEVTVAEGWYCGRLGFLGGREDIYGDTLGLIALVKITYADGTEQSMGTDSSWAWNTTAITSSSIYDGETVNYSEPHHLVSTSVVTCLSLPKTLCAPDGPPVKRLQEMSVHDIIHSRSGKTILDFGQNLVGRVRATIDGPRGTKVSFSHAEVLEDGELSIRPLRGAKACDSVILSGQGPIQWEPAFTFHGFRYVQVDGWPGDLDPKRIRGIVLHTDMRRTGFFECSNPMLNKLHENVIWSMRGNFVSLPTDCPQRDERLGWTGDINIFSDTANYLYDTRGMLISWLKDLAAEQNDCGGLVPLIVPNVIPSLGNEAHALWGDVAIMLPWSLYQASGDRQILEEQMHSMKAWLKAIPRRSNDLWNYSSDWKLGDWLDPLAPPQDPGNTTTDPDFVSNAFLFRTVETMSQICEILDEKDAEAYREESHRVRRAFSHEYVAPSGRVAGDTQTAYALALAFSLLDECQSHRAAERLEELVRRNSRFKIATGFAGTPYIGHALAKMGKANIFYRMLVHRDCPSWLYPVSMGATTMWERWDSMLPDGHVNPGEMTSFNHYALGAVASWMHRVILGLYQISAGWKNFAIQPVPGGDLRWAKGSFNSAYGECEVFWEVQDDDSNDDGAAATFHLTARVPPNTTAHVKLPGLCEVYKCGSGTHTWSVPFTHDEWPPRAFFPPFSDEDDVLSIDAVIEPPKNRDDVLSSV